MSARDHYEVLGVSRSATADEIKSAFKRLAAMHHPDRNPGDASATERFKEVASAYQVLGDAQRRSMYDRFGHRAEGVGSPFGAGGPFAGGVVDMSELNVDGILGDLLGVFGVGKGDRGDLKRELEVSFEEAAFGCEKELRYERIVACGDCTGTGAAKGSPPIRCNACEGRGRVRFQQGFFPIAVERTCSQCRGRGQVVQDPCRECRGSGLVTSESTLKINLPPGIDAGATKLVPNAGNRPRADKTPGDLEITVRVAPHPFFRRIGDDVSCAVPITFSQAALGGEVDVPTLDGRGKLRVPPGTQPGNVLRIKAKGIPKRGGVGGARGDQLVEVQVEVPSVLTDRQRELIELLAKELGEHPQPQQRTFLEKLKNLFG